MIRGRRKGQPRWSDRDRLLALAWQLYQESLCPDCQQERTRAMHPDMDGWFEVEALTCHACAALEADRDAQKEHRRSRKEFIRDTYPRDRELPPWVATSPD